ncbi:hypothetical protein [Vibrio gazogenes]|uniref:SMODS-associating 2TM beta-strand rich effector domain-containing protein n=1 Tax=Vibrio gazogenes DSM 21264 = NBRC 103151 TaxID=1123492 RepID=A0A1M5FIP1_VIBGA|nr:hypothetical protein [Vibrio gazogenes]USP14454.1 hypothetical protein MKS89_03810 [Vibrio gazogenes]SHF91447.1 hypothetical protein SAMN02745781_03488 [Vibrio gazogenes DSM 21264] [Vibrio gazogenes DSM 21264 = NBRC 103151]SJN52815.1 hypothetical protein BQ6471_00087 [Vibrio gazogenes]
MNYTETILLGVSSGIVSAFLVWVCVKSWNATFTPWLRKQIYRGVEVQGEWTAVIMHDNDGRDVSEIGDAVETINYVLNIESQYGHVVKGWFSQSYKNSERESQGRYKVTGQIMDGVLMLSLSPSMRSKSSFGTLLMYVAASGGMLDGIFTYKGVKTNTIKSTDITLEKRV